jgi:hypothetical protein
MNLSPLRLVPCLTYLALLLGLAAVAARPPAADDKEEPVFRVTTAAGKVVRGPLRRLTADWEVEVGKGVRRRVAGADVVYLRQEGLPGPPLPTDEHLILANGDRLPVRGLRLDGERLHFTHPDLDDGKGSSLPLSAVVVYWRAAPDKVVSPEKLRRRLARASRTRDTVLLRNGDVLEGVLNGLDDKGVEVEVEKKAVRARLGQVAAVALSTDLADKLPVRGVHARLALTETDEGASGGRLTLTTATFDGKHLLRGKTAFGARVRVPVERVAALDLAGGRAVSLSDLKPAEYVYRPYLDERWPWVADGSATGGDLRLGGATYDKGLGVHASCRLTYRLDGAYERFEALVGLDALDGRKGQVRVRLLGDGKALDLGGTGRLSHAGGPLAVRVPVAGVKQLTLEVEGGADGPVQAVVNWADARLVRKKD